MKRSTFLLFATLILLGAAFLRIADLHRYPPGLHYDEAADMLLSRDVAFNGYNPFPVVTAYSGREALFYYLAVPLLRIFGANIMATRLTSAFLGILTVAATIALGKALTRDQALALLAGAWLAVSGPEVWLTRQGFRTSPQPFLEALGLWLLWIALRRSRNWLLPALLGGVFSGLALYVYMAARIIPVWLAMMLTLLIVLDGRQRGFRLRQAVTAFAALVVTAIPILAWYVANPNIFLDRLNQLAPTGDTPSIGQSVLLHLQMFFIKGDPILRYNLDVGRPFFDPVSGALLLIGLGVAVWMIARGRGALNRLSAAFMLLSPLLIAPSVIAVNGFPPSHMRSVSMVPLIFFLPALGLISLYRWLRPRAPRIRVSVWRWMAVILTVGLGLLTWRDYQAWAARSDVFLDADGDLNAAAIWLENSAPPDALIYIASNYYDHPTVRAHNIDPARIRWMMLDHLILPPPDRHAIYIFPHSADFAFWRQFFGDACVDASAAQPYASCDVPAGMRLPIPSIPLNANISGLLALNGADLPDVPSGQSSDTLIYWRVLRTPDQPDLKPVFALIDDQGNELGRSYPYFESSNHWLPGETIIERVKLAIPYGNPPGVYKIKATWINAALQNLPLHDDQGRFAGLWAEIGPLKVLPASQSVAIPANAVRVIPDIYAQPPADLTASIRQGEHLHFTVTWFTDQKPQASEPLQLVVTPKESSGAPVILWKGQPIHDTYPMADWLAPQKLIDRYDAPIPPDLPAGRYTLTLSVGADHPVFSVDLDIVQVDRRFTIPALAHPANLRFGDTITLAGYEIQPAANGQITVKLAWQANGTPDRDYAVFVHLTTPDGTIFSQRDSQPSRPTNQWIANEVITDTYTLPAPSGDYKVSLGLYLQENGLRLPINGPDGQPLGDELMLKP